MLYLISVIISGVLYYFMLPPLNFSSLAFWVYLTLVLILFVGVTLYYNDSKSWNSKYVVKIVGGAVTLFLVVFIIGGLVSVPMFRANSYANLLTDNVTVKDISEYTPTISDVPLLDRDTAELLGSRKMGTLVNEVSQFRLGVSTQINYQNTPVRVMPLEYDGFFKWLNNRKDGIPSYIVVNMNNQQTSIVNLSEGMCYSPSGCFGDDLNRYLRFKFPTTMLGEPVFEIDEDGNPYWVVSKLVHRIGLFGGTDVNGIIVVDAITGKITEYGLTDIPTTIDNVYPTKVLLNLYDSYGLYQDGFLNSLFGQKGCIIATDGYNYIPLKDDVYIYTGVTSVVSDESNIGFVFMNKRTKDVEYYEIAGAEEYSAMASAEGMVQHLGYVATFPLLLQIEGQPTYCVSLKDDAGLVKMYGLVNMSQYQIVVTGDTMNECLTKYRTALKNSGQSVIEVEQSKNVGIVEDIRTANIEGTTYFYVKVIDNPIYYAFSIVENEEIVLVNVGDTVEFDVSVGAEGSIIRGILVKILKN